MTLLNSGIYLIRNTYNNKVYVGSSVHIKNRFAGHRATLRTGKHKNPKLQAAWNKYGEANFEFGVLEYYDLPELTKIEENWISYYNSAETGYNVAKNCTVSPTLGVKMSDEVRTKMREAHLGSKNHFYGKHHSEETKQRIKQKKLGIKQNEEINKKRSLATKGIPKSEETKNRMKLAWEKRKNKI
jgi:group I intron endonuclease